MKAPIEVWVDKNLDAYDPHGLHPMAPEPILFIEKSAYLKLERMYDKALEALHFMAIQVDENGDKYSSSILAEMKLKELTETK